MLFPNAYKYYLNTLHTYGEFDNKMDKPVLEFISVLLDVTIIKPLIEMCTGYDLITGEDLSDFERGMKGIFAVVDIVTLMVGIKASGVAKIFSKEAVDLLSNGAAYGVGKAGEDNKIKQKIFLDNHHRCMGFIKSIVYVWKRYFKRNICRKVDLYLGTFSSVFRCNYITP